VPDPHTRRRRDVSEREQELEAALSELVAIVQHGDAPAYGNLPQTDLASRWYVRLAAAVEEAAERLGVHVG
jgi:hypothetical protein